MCFTAQHNIIICNKEQRLIMHNQVMHIHFCEYIYIYIYWYDVSSAECISVVNCDSLNAQISQLSFPSVCIWWQDFCCS